MANILSPFFILSSICTFLLGIWVISINFRSRVYFAWLLFCLSVALWSFGLGILTWVKSENLANIFYFIHYLGAIHIPIAFLYFIRVYFLRDEKITLDVGLGIVLAELHLYWFLAGELVASLTPKWLFTFYTNPGKYYVFYMIYFSFYVMYSFYLMFKSYAQIPMEKRRKIFFIIATALGYTGGSSAFLLVYIDSLPPFGILIFPLFPILTTYAIVRHRFLDIEVIIKKTLVFAGLASFVFGVFVVVTFVIQDLFAQHVTSGKWTKLLLSTILVVIGYDPLRRFLIEITDRYLFQKGQEMRVILKDLAEKVVAIGDLKQIGRMILSTLVNTFRLESGMIVIYDRKNKQYRLWENIGFESEESVQSVRHYMDNANIREYLKHHPIISLDDPSIESLPDYVSDWMKTIKGRVCISLLIDENQSGVLIFGKKKSDQDFTAEEMDYFSTIASQTELAVRNACLIETVVQEREAKVQAEHLAKRVEFAGMIKHEIQNKLVHIQTPANTTATYCVPRLRKWFKEHDEELFSEMCDEIVKGARNINFAVEHISIIAQTARKGVDEKDKSFEQLDFKLIWEDAKKESGLIKRCDFESSMPERFYVYCNYHALQRTFVNLIRNAYDAMKDIKEPLIKLRCAYQEVEGRQTTFFELEDSGCGIPDEIRGKIFEDGFSTKSKPDAKDLLSSGHGQGLAACKLYIEGIHNGKLWFESGQGRGTTFKFWLPMKEG